MMPGRSRSEAAPAVRADRRLAWLLLWLVAVGVLLSPLIVPVVELLTSAPAPQELQWIPPAVGFGSGAIIVALRPSLRAQLAGPLDLIRSASPTERTVHWVGLVVSLASVVGLFLAGQVVPEPWRDLVLGFASDATLVFGFCAGMLLVLVPPPRASSSSQPPPP
jgi:hypothetical protein